MLNLFTIFNKYFHMALTWLKIWNHKISDKQVPDTLRYVNKIQYFKSIHAQLSDLLMSINCNLNILVKADLCVWVSVYYGRAHLWLHYLWNSIGSFSLFWGIKVAYNIKHFKFCACLCVCTVCLYVMYVCVCTSSYKRLW